MTTASKFPLRLLPHFVSALAAMMLTSAAVAAETLYDNGTPINFPLANGFEMTQWIDADDFTLLSEARVESVVFWNIQIAGGFNGVVLYQIYANDENNLPGALVHTGMASPIHVATGYAEGPYEEFVNSFSIDPVTLPPGTYWLALHNGPLSNNLNRFVYWSSTGATGTRASQSDIGPLFAGLWASNSVAGGAAELAFNLSGLYVPRITSVSLVDRKPHLAFTSTAGYNYRLEYKDAVTDMSWSPVPNAPVMTGTGGVLEMSDPNTEVGSPPARFYRAAVL